MNNHQKGFLLLVIIQSLFIICSCTLHSEIIIKEAKINYVTIGEGRPVVILHGFGVDHRQMTGCLEPIFVKRKQWKRIYIDLPGMGSSFADLKMANSDKVLQLISSLIDKVIGQKEFVLVGHSYGGYLARALVIERAPQIKGLLLITPMAHPKMKAEKYLPQKKIAYIDSDFIESLDKKDATIFTSLAVIQTKRVYERFVVEIKPGMADANQDFLLKLRAEGYSLSYDPNLSDIRLVEPTLILTGRNDYLQGYEMPFHLLDFFPEAEFVVVNNAGPLLQIEQEELFNFHVNRWLDDIEKRWDKAKFETEKEVDSVSNITN
jgi:pimeloyl-ACP methyl ester carboxylesterase